MSLRDDLLTVLHGGRADRVCLTSTTFSYNDNSFCLSFA